MTTIDAFLPLGMTLGISAFGMIGAWYVWPVMQRSSQRDALIPLLLPHCFRYIGLAFLIPGVTTAPLDPRFAMPAATGDLLAAFLALASILALKANMRGATALVWLFSIVGLADFANSLARGLTFVAPGQMGATYFIPFLVVPAMLVTQALIVARLWSGRAEIAKA